MQHFFDIGQRWLCLTEVNSMIFDTRFSEKEAMQYGVVDGNATIIKYEGDDMRVVIPASIDGFKVTKIEPYAFSEKSMKYIQFPDTWMT